MSAYEALQLAIRLRKKKQEQKQEEPMPPAPKPRRISREEAIVLLHLMKSWPLVRIRIEKALDMAIRALKREQKAADAKKKDKRRMR
jgi:hypothetical protein